MVRTNTSKTLKLAAVDLDGTLLGHDGQISSANKDAVRRLQSAGLEVVLASGRHHRNMVKYANALPGVHWLVSSQGGELSNVARTEILTAEFLASDLVFKTLELGRSKGFTTVLYSTEGVFTDSAWNFDLEFYTDLSGHRPTPCPAKELASRAALKLLWMGTPENVESTVGKLHLNPEEIQTVQTHKRLLEFMPVGVSKASALQILARYFAVDASEVVAFGDGDNDVSMFQWAGVSVAMAHGWPAAVKSAKFNSGEGSQDTAFARAVDLLFENNLLVAADSDEARAA